MAKVTCRICGRQVKGRASPDERPGTGAYPVAHNDPRTGERCPGSDDYAVEAQPFVQTIGGVPYP